MNRRGQSSGSVHSGNQQQIDVNSPHNCHNRNNQNALGKTGGRTVSEFTGDRSVYDMRKTALTDHYNNLVTKNQHIFDHLSGKCICGMCICGRCKCPRQVLQVDYKKGGQSEYQKEFDKKNNNQPRVDDTYYKMQYHNKQPMELSTTNRVDYDEKDIPEYKRHQLEQNRDKYLPFAGVSSYADTFQKYPNNPVASIKPAAHPTVLKDMPFAGKTSYNVNFKGDQVPYDPEIEYMINKNKRGQFKSPLNPDFPFLDETSNGHFYQPYRTKKQQSTNNKNKHDPLPAFDGQFLTTKQADYDAKNKKPCPARVILNTMYEEDLKKTIKNQSRGSLSRA